MNEVKSFVQSGCRICRLVACAFGELGCAGEGDRITRCTSGLMRFRIYNGHRIGNEERQNVAVSKDTAGASSGSKDILRFMPFTGRRF